MIAATWDIVATTWLMVLAESAIRTLVLAASVAAGLAMFRVRRPAIRLFAWAVVLYASVAITLFGPAIPDLQVPIPEIAAFSPASAMPLADTAASQVPRASASYAGDPTVVTSVAPPAPSRAPQWSLFAAAIYFIVAFGLLARLAIGWAMAWRLERSATAIDSAEIDGIAAPHVVRAGLTSIPRFAESDRVFVPLATSAFRPTIVLPAGWRTWPDEKLDAVLAHELAHVSRRDATTQRLALTYRAVFWINPFAWWVRRELVELAELASDDAALGAGVDPAVYAETLLGFLTARSAAPARAAWHVAMAQSGERTAVHRVERVLASIGPAPATTTTRAVVGVLIALSPALTLAAAVRFEPIGVPALRLPLAAASDALMIPRRAFREPSELESSSLEAHVDAPARPVVSPATVRGMSTFGAIVAPAAPIALVAPEPSSDSTSNAALLVEGGDASYLDVQDPVLLQRVDAKYTTEAMEAKIQGVVFLDVVVLADGSVGEVRLVQSLDRAYGLDARAMAAAKAWRFQPGTRLDPATGQRVAMSTVARLELQFHLH